MGCWVPGAKVQSVRELAIELAVNARTVLSAYDLMQEEGIIASRRGMGYYLEMDALEKVREVRRKEFFDSTLLQVYDDMKQLGITPDEVYEVLKSKIEKNK